MTDVIRILVVEDDDDIFETYQDAVEDLGGDVELELTRESSADEAIKALLSTNFDGAIVDLNLNKTDSSEASGNSVLINIIEKHRFPVIVVSGNIQNLDDNIRQKESMFLQFCLKDATTSNEDILNEFISIYKTGITKIIGGRGQIENLLGEIFWKHIANIFPEWKPTGNNLERVLLRYTLSHLSEYLSLDEGDDVYFYNAEVYIKPPIREHIATGDIVDSDGKRHIVLSPSCDVAVRNVDNGKPIINASKIILAPLIEISRSSFIEHGIIQESSNNRERDKTIKEIVKGNREKFGFLPAYDNMYAAVIDFQNIITCDLDDFISKNRMATISGSFLKDIQSKFSSYLARQGQPDLDKNTLIKDCKELISPNS